MDRSQHPEVSDADWKLFEAIASEEPLHPDLAAYVTDTEFGPSLRHPLVYEVMGMRPGLANLRYKQKQEALAEAIEEGAWGSYVFLHERPWRTDALMTVRDTYGDRIEDAEFWDLMGLVWTDSENIWQNYAEWDDLLNTDRPERDSIMTQAERDILASLPDTITVYRGAIPGMNEGGLSWTTDHAVARFFAKRWNKDFGHGAIYTAEVPKVSVVAYFEGRNESEVVVEHYESIKIISSESVAPAD